MNFKKISFFLFISIAIFSNCALNSPGFTTVVNNVYNVNLQLVWKKQLFPPNEGAYYPRQGGRAVISPESGLIFIGNNKGELYSLNLNTGSTEWRFKAKGAIRSEPVLIGNEKKELIFGSDDGYLYCLEVNNKGYKKLWESYLQTEIRNKPIINEKTAYITNANNTIFSISLENGSEIWSNQHKNTKNGLTVEGYSNVLFHNGKIITGFSDGTVAAFDQIAGQISWETNIINEADFSSTDYISPSLGLLSQPRFDIDATPIIFNSKLWISSIDGGLCVINPDNGSIEWKREDLTRITSLTVKDNMVILNRAGYGLIAMNKQGDIIWETKLGPGIYLEPVFYKNVIFISDSNGPLWFLNKTNGKVLGKINSSYGFSAPFIYKNNLFVLGQRGTFMNFAIKTL